MDFAQSHVGIVIVQTKRKNMSTHTKKILKEGDGPAVAKGNTVTVHAKVRRRLELRTLGRIVC